MAGDTNIEWATKVWNPLAGCSVLSPGCTNCYAMKMAARIEAMAAGSGRSSAYDGLTRKTKAGAVWTGDVHLVESALTQPMRWKKPSRIFVNSMSDLFHESVPDAVIDQVFAVMALSPQHTFQVLTKRAERMRAYLTTRNGIGNSALCRAINDIPPNLGNSRGALEMPLPNVWLGVSTEDKARADERIPHLLATPAAVRFLSAEPLLGAIHMGRTYENGKRCQDYLTGQTGVMYPDGPDFDDGPSLDWVIVGGESGPGARPMHPDWARQIRDQCAAAGMPFFFKQWGAWVPYIDRDVQDPDWRQDYRRTEAATSFRWLNLAGGMGFHGERFHVMQRVGKRAAGRLLDGVEHNAMPRGRA